MEGALPGFSMTQLPGPAPSEFNWFLSADRASVPLFLAFNFNFVAFIYF